ncbi:hypothetical protein DL764_004788 [Monosporascus ibericus]|uniref:LSM domain-containing protein n=1 Tax=Monosporascus ibericus TaxID=155417 RepID=A0A4Q4TE48_9PEZI|nr:hypothetical protein DL764_004788 [Monosporascus ibericus]
MDPAQEKVEAEAFLHTLINKTLRVHTTDSRIFVGTFKCTDPVRLDLLLSTSLRFCASGGTDSGTHLQKSNVILAMTHEYRPPSTDKVGEAAAAAAHSGDDTVKMNMTSRYLGLIVIPGRYIVKMEVEEFVSQLKSR